MENAIRSFSITTQSAILTSSFCYRRSVRDSWKIWNVLTCDRAIEIYRLIYRAIVLACEICFTLGQIARRESDNLVDWAQSQPIAPERETVPVSSVPQVEEVKPLPQVEEMPLSSSLTCPLDITGRSLTALRTLARVHGIPRYSRLTKEEVLAIFS